MTETSIQHLYTLSPSDLNELCDATETTLSDDSLSFSTGLNRSTPPTRDYLESYWKGVLLVPERELFVGRVDRVIAASIQLVKPNPNEPTKSFVGRVDHHFVAPWARGHGLAKELLFAAEAHARDLGLSVLRLNVRANLGAAVALYESCGYQCFGKLDPFEMIDGNMIAGHFYYKHLE